MLFWCAGSTDGSETGSDEGSPLGPKGGGTLKTCAICLEDYRYDLEVSLHSGRGLLHLSIVPWPENVLLGAVYGEFRLVASQTLCINRP